MGIAAKRSRELVGDKSVAMAVSVEPRSILLLTRRRFLCCPISVSESNLDPATNCNEAREARIRHTQAQGHRDTHARSESEREESREKEA